jgi:hypothetical protein
MVSQVYPGNWLGLAAALTHGSAKEQPHTAFQTCASVTSPHAIPGGILLPVDRQVDDLPLVCVTMLSDCTEPLVLSKPVRT